ncbi:hypothetical protein SAMN05443633_103272 [Chryseobacterium arachidis]|uniref:Uncharacterized protein n=1 Tax=Chryseobacterium arachidis TaxID=1416778 RepID=A0A1M4ZUJ4_9FLAO|nr:hypothetical protein SAMN05443633_103272 [Chryseobacterium arachidis]
MLDQNNIKLLTSSEKPHIKYIKLGKAKNIAMSVFPSEQLIKVIIIN